MNLTVPLEDAGEGGVTDNNYADVVGILRTVWNQPQERTSDWGGRERICATATDESFVFRFFFSVLQVPSIQH